MKILCLGAVGEMAIEATRDLVPFRPIDEIILADANIEKANALQAEFGESRVKTLVFDAHNYDEMASLLQESDYFMSGLPYQFSEQLIKAAVESGVSGTDINFVPEQLQFHDSAIKKNITLITGIGATPGITNLLAKKMSEDLVKPVEEINIHFAAWRSLSMSPGLVDTTIWELHPLTPERCYFENGKYVKVEPFSGGRVVQFPEPIGPREVYYMAHPEPLTIPRWIEAKKVTLRGTWPPEVMELFRYLNRYGFFKKDPITINIKGVEVNSEDFIREFLVNEPLAREHNLWQYALNVEVIGKSLKKGQIKRTAMASHPPMDRWGGRQVYSKFVAIPLSVATQMIIDGTVKARGVLPPEACIDPNLFLDKLVLRGFEFSFQEVAL